MKESRLNELQTMVDAAQAEMNTIRRELGISEPDKETPAQSFQAERDSQPNPFATNFGGKK